jgi:hypothetical protein
MQLSVSSRNRSSQCLQYLNMNAIEKLKQTVRGLQITFERLCDII